MTIDDYENYRKQLKSAYAVVAKCRKTLDILAKEGEGIPLSELPADYLAALASAKLALKAAERVLLEKNNVCVAAQGMLLAVLGM